MFVVRTATLAHGTASAARAFAQLRELESLGHDVTVTDSTGRRLDAMALATIVAADKAMAPPR